MYNEKSLIRNIHIKIGSNRNINNAEVYQESHSVKIHLMTSSVKSLKETIALLPTCNQKVLAEQNNDKKLAIAILIVSTGLISFHFCRSFGPE